MLLARYVFFRLSKSSFNAKQSIFKQNRNDFVFFRQAAPFCDMTKHAEDELASYEKYLLKFNDSIHKPHQKMRNEQQRIIQKYLNEGLYSQVITFLSNNSSNSLGDVSTASKIDAELVKNWSSLSQKDQHAAAFSLAKFRQTKTFDLFKQPIQKKIKNEGISSVECEKLIIYLCGELINRKSLRFIGKFQPKVTDRKQIYQKIYQYIDQKQYKGPYYKQKKNLLQYIGLMLDPTLNKREDIFLNRQRSPLETTIESFLGVLGIQYERQVKINNFYVDYLVKARKDGGSVQNFILQVNGNHHYTITGKLKGREIFRNLIINEYAPLRIIHFKDFLISKGNRNKLAYIESLFSQKTINWESQNRGKNSHWEVKIDQEHIPSKPQ